jgi:hypothetical protein
MQKILSVLLFLDGFEDIHLVQAKVVGVLF